MEQANPRARSLGMKGNGNVLAKTKRSTANTSATSTSQQIAPAGQMKMKISATSGRLAVAMMTPLPAMIMLTQALMMALTQARMTFTAVAMVRVALATTTLLMARTTTVMIVSQVESARTVVCGRASLKKRKFNAITSVMALPNVATVLTRILRCAMHGPLVATQQQFLLLQRLPRQRSKRRHANGLTTRATANHLPVQPMLLSLTFVNLVRQIEPVALWEQKYFLEVFCCRTKLKSSLQSNSP